MNKLKIIVLVTISFLSCKNDPVNLKTRFLSQEIPKDVPMIFKQDIVPAHRIIHRGIFSPGFEAYYYTLSDKDFQNFDIYVIRKVNNTWSEPEKVFFNTTYNEHGMSFSPDGNSIYFSSTRPVGIDSLPSTWHIWKSDKVNDQWTKPEFVDIPNLRDKLVSHPTITNSGTLYFHSSNLDYSEMDIYRSKQVNGTFQNAEKISISLPEDTGKCTPYVAPNEDFLIFATIGNQLDLQVSFNDGQGNWITTKKLNDTINNLGQGNPYVTPDHQFLFFATGDHHAKKWNIKWVNIASELKIN